MDCCALHAQGPVWIVLTLLIAQFACQATILSMILAFAVPIAAIAWVIQLTVSVPAVLFLPLLLV